MHDTDKLTYVHWRRRGEAKPGEAIGGQCPADQVPSYGEVGTASLPKAIHDETEQRADGSTVRILRTPPVFGTRHAYYFHVVLVEHTAEKLRTGSLADLRRLMDPRRIEGPSMGVSRENWWWARGSREFGTYCETPPLKLCKKWIGPLLDILTRDHCRRAEILAEWDRTLASHRNHSKDRDAHAYEQIRRFGRKRAGDMVLARRPIHFVDGSVRQVFVLKPYGRRDQLRPHDSYGTHYKVAAKNMFPIGAAWLEEAAPAPPVAVAALLALQATELASAQSAHDRIAVLDRTGPLLRLWHPRAEAWLAETRSLAATLEHHDEGSLARKAAARAAQNAIIDYCLATNPGVRLSRPDPDSPVQRLRNDLHALLSLLGTIPETVRA